MFCALVYIPGLAQVFHHGPINLWPDWAFLFASGPTLLIADEIRKFFVRRRMARDEVFSGTTVSRDASVSAVRRRS